MPVSITPASVPGLVSLNRVRRAIGWPAGKTTQHDTLLQEWIDAWSRQFREDAGQPIQKETLVEIFEGNGRDEFTLSAWPVSNLAKLERETAFDTWEELSADTYILRGSGACRWIKLNGWFIAGVTYRATYDVGYDTVPPNISRLVLNAVILDYLDSRIGEGRLGIVSKAVAASEGGDGGATITFSRSDFEKRWKRATDQYSRVPTVG